MKLYAVGIFKGGLRQLPHSPHPISTIDSMDFCQKHENFTAHFNPCSILGNPAL